MSTTLNPIARLTEAGGQTFEGSTAGITVEGLQKIVEIDIADTDSDREINIVDDISVARIGVFLIITTKAMTIKVNDDTTPESTIACRDNGFICATGEYMAGFVTANLTHIFVTGGSEAGKLTILVGHDVTP